MIDGNLYWMDRKGEAIMTPLRGSYTAAKKWGLPANSAKVRISSNHGIVSVLDMAGNNAAYSEYRFTTGEISRSKIELDWLNPLIQTVPEGGVTRIVAIPQ